MTEDQLAEVSGRHKVAQLIRCILMVLQSSYTILPAASWYAAKVFWSCSRAKKLKVPRFIFELFSVVYLKLSHFACCE